MRYKTLIAGILLAGCSQDLGALQNFQDRCLAEIKTKITSPSSITVLRITAVNTPGDPSESCREADDIERCERLRAEKIPQNYQAPLYSELADGSPIDYWAEITFDLNEGARRRIVCEGQGVKGKAISTNVHIVEDEEWAL